MTEKRFVCCFEGIEDKWETEEEYKYTPCTKDGFQDLCEMLNELNDENKHLKQELKRCRDWLNSDKYDYELTLAFIKNKGYSLKDVLEYEKELNSE